MTEATQTRLLPSRVVWLGAFYVAEMVVVILAFQVLSQIECRQTAIDGACRALRGLSLLALFGLAAVLPGLVVLLGPLW